MKKLKAIVLTGYGINCDYETEFALQQAGFEAKRVHVNDLIEGKEKLESYALFAFPGGFSFGDDLGAGKALSNKILHSPLKEALLDFVQEKKLVVGICNGFQIITKLGLLPALNRKYFEQTVSLSFNDSGRFEDRWVKMKVNAKSKCVFTKGIDFLELPVRHGEGKFVPLNQQVLEEINEKNLVVVQYTDSALNATQKYPLNPNGSIEAIAGICNEAGTVFGLMPHPEAHLFFENHPKWTRIKEELKRAGKKPPSKGHGMKVFENAFQYAQKTA